MKTLPSQIVAYATRTYKQLLEELTPAERKAVLTILTLFSLGLAVKLIRAL